MSDYPRCFSTIIRTAIRSHKCCECGNTIYPKEKYQYCKGNWEGKWEDYKTCGPCAGLRDEIMSEAFEDEYPNFGELLEYDRERERSK